MQGNDQLISNDSCNESVCKSNGFWSKHCDNVSYNQLHKFWFELSPQTQKHLLRIDKQTLFEQARKNMYCSRCNGFLLEVFTQIVMDGKSLPHQKAKWQFPCNRLGLLKDQINGGPGTAVCHDKTQDPSVHPWGGLTTTKDGALTLFDCYLYSKNLKGLQNVFDSARARERERVLLYPDACGGGGRGWISQGKSSYGRGHGTRETCALHTARLSCDTLVGFWSALGEETRQSLLRMKEEDFIERLMYRFDSKRFCRDCRRNVTREFKELKELKRMHRDPWCTSWFCVADMAFQYEVSNNTIHADWHQTFNDSIGAYHHFEWAVGSGEGKSDILGFENVGKNQSVRVSGLDLGGLNVCYITLRAYKLKGDPIDFSGKAHALKGKQCVHYKLVVGDGCVTITHGEGIKRFFEHAEEIEEEEEEDDDFMDKDGNDLDGECSRPQKHAKSPELAREFLLDAATVIFKEQVEKAFREGTARQNAHSVFISLALKLLEDRIHVACKEIITLEKQMKLLEEEEQEKQEEEERKERKRMKEREKKLRKKERMRQKDGDKKCISLIADEASCDNIRDSVSETGETTISVCDESSSNDCNSFNDVDGEPDDVREVQPEASSTCSDKRQGTKNGTVACKSQSRHSDESCENPSKVITCSNKHTSANNAKLNVRSNGARFNQKMQCSNIRNDPQFCGCTQQIDYRPKVDSHLANIRYSRDIRPVAKWESASEMRMATNRVSKFIQTVSPNVRDNYGRLKNKTLNYSINGHYRDFPHTKKVWEPVESQKRHARCNSDSNVSSRSHSFKTEGIESDQNSKELVGDSHVNYVSSNRVHSSSQNVDVGSIKDCNLNWISDISACSNSSSNNCSSSLSERDSNTPSTVHPNTESVSSSNSEESNNPERKKSTQCIQNGLIEEGDDGVGKEGHHNIDTEGGTCSSTPSHDSISPSVGILPQNTPSKTVTSEESKNVKISSCQTYLHRGTHPSTLNPNIPFPVFEGPLNMGYYNQSPIAWPIPPDNGFMSYPHPNPNHCLMTSPFGHHLSGDSHMYMQLGPIQHATPYLVSNQFPVYHQVNPQEQIHPLKTNAIGNPSRESRRENVVPTNIPKQAPQTGTVEKGNSMKPDTGNTGFSLFQFGGPVAFPTCRSSIQSSMEGKSCGVESDNICTKKETIIEEYNLFAARNGLQFSIL